ncbi:MAG: flagellar export chaperone FliS [Gammaproteobacteria bacterium]|nr:flagellar export chaperone FliS [Gammaproteobacteria bacterium]
MHPANAYNLLRQYGESGELAEVLYASPHRLIQMLLDGALDRLASAKGHMLRGEVAAKGNRIRGALLLIGGLRSSLNKEAGGSIARNLDMLYDYMERRLVLANANNDPEVLGEVVSLLMEIKTAWDAIPDSIKLSSGTR